MKLQVEVTAHSLHRRSGPAVTFSVISYLQKGDRGYVVEEKNGWYRWEIGGWSNKNYVKVLKNMETSTLPGKTNTTPPKQADPNKPPASTIDYNAVNNALGGDGNAVGYSAVGNGKAIGTPSTDVAKTRVIKDGSVFPPNVNITNYALDYGFIQNNLDAIRQNLNLIVESRHENIKEILYERFNRFKIAFPDVHLSKSFSHVFFTRPDLNILDQSGNLLPQFANDPMFYYLYKNNPKMIKSLTKELNSTHDFHPFLSNSAESFELSDEFIKTIEHGATLTGYKVQYGKHNIESNSAGSFSVSYTDDSDLGIYKTHKAWMEYISKVYRGEVSPKRDYILKKILDYACSVYYIICAPDGETILLWSKFFGVFPTNTPSSAFSWAKGGMVKIPQFTINYSYAFKEDCNPLSLAEFNMNSRADLVYKKTYEPLLLSTGRSMSGAPFIETGKDSSGHYVYKLRFRKE